MIEKTIFGEISKKQVFRYTLSNCNGVRIEAIDYGCAVVRFIVPDNKGNPVDIVLGYDDIEGYIKQDVYLGSVIGRHANRISGASFKIPGGKSGKTYSLIKNDGENHLHGGKEGFDKKLWDSHEDGDAIVFSYFSSAGEEGYPGNLTVQVRYSLDDKNNFSIAYEASSDAETPCNLTNHSYFNLGGHNSGYIGAHEVHINSDFYTPTDKYMIPTGGICPVDQTPMDLRPPQPIDAGIHSNHGQITKSGGFDGNWVLSHHSDTPAAIAYARETGIKLSVYTDMPCLQFYTGNFLRSFPPGKGGTLYGPHAGFCFETQMYPDSFNNSFPKALLKPGEVYSHKTVYNVGLYTA